MTAAEIFDAFSDRQTVFGPKISNPDAIDTDCLIYRIGSTQSTVKLLASRNRYFQRRHLK